MEATARFTRQLPRAHWALYRPTSTYVARGEFLQSSSDNLNTRHKITLDVLEMTSGSNNGWQHENDISSTQVGL